MVILNAFPADLPVLNQNIPDLLLRIVGDDVSSFADAPADIGVATGDEHFLA